MASAFSHIFGQVAAVDWLSRAYEADRLPHALIFAGPAGVGKATTARALAKLFLCESPNGVGPCGKCNSCRVFEAGNHPDFHAIYRQLIRLTKKDSKARDLAIDTVRDYFLDPAGRMAVMGRGKAFVVDEADAMNADAQNATLKTLEEPAGRTLIILLTDAPGLLLQTIRSRCQLVRFAALDGKVVERELIKRGISAPDAADAAVFAEGSLGVALRWIEDGVVPIARDLAARMTQTLSGRASGDLPEFFKKAADAYAEKQLERDELASKDQATREGLGLYLRLAAMTFRKALRTASGEDAEKACRAIDAIDRAGTMLDSNVNTSLVLQQLALELERQFA